MKSFVFAVELLRNSALKYSYEKATILDFMNFFDNILSNIVSLFTYFFNFSTYLQ